MPGPLEGVRVLDLTTMVAGPVAAMMLADQGADVIKVESPAGDLMRRFAFGRNGMSASFLSCNRNKRSLAIDMKSAEGFQIVEKLIATADVLMHNFRPGAAERVGVGEEAVRAIRPDIIYVSLSGFGESGPYANQRADDPHDYRRLHNCLDCRAGNYGSAVCSTAIRCRAACPHRDARFNDFLSVA